MWLASLRISCAGERSFSPLERRLAGLCLEALVEPQQQQQQQRRTEQHVGQETDRGPGPVRGGR